MDGVRHDPSRQATFAATLAERHGTAPDEFAAGRVLTLALDTVAIAHHARTRALGGAALPLPCPPGPAAVWGGGTGEAGAAALLNGTAAEVLDFQEVLIDGRNNGHAAVVIVPAILALAAEVRSPAAAILAALRAAFLANIGLARALGRAHRARGRGFRTTSLTAPVAAAMGGALMLGGGAGEASHAAGLAAASLPAGLLAAVSPEAGDFTPDKDWSVGLSARHAVEAARLARGGARGPADALTGPRGWLSAYGFEDTRPDLLALPEDDALAAYALKLYPANFGCQCAIRLALDLGRGLDPADVRAVTVRVKASSAASLSARALPSHVAARFSLPYAVASALARGRSALPDYDDGALADPAVRALMDRIEVVADDGMEARHLQRGTFPAHLRIEAPAGPREGAIEAPQEGMSPADIAAALADKIAALCPPDLAAGMAAALDARDPAILARLAGGPQPENAP